MIEMNVNMFKSIKVLLILLLGASFKGLAQEANDLLGVQIVDALPIGNIVGSVSLHTASDLPLSQLVKTGDRIRFEYYWMTDKSKVSLLINSSSQTSSICERITTGILEEEFPGDNVINSAVTKVTVLDVLSNQIIISDELMYERISTYGEGSNGLRDFLVERDNLLPISICNGDLDRDFVELDPVRDFNTYNLIESEFIQANFVRATVVTLNATIALTSDNYCALDIEVLLEDPLGDFRRECEDFKINRIDYNIIRTDVNNSASHHSAGDLDLTSNDRLFYVKHRLHTGGTYKVTAEIDYSCNDCRDQIHVESDPIVIGQPEIAIDINQFEPTLCSMNFNYTPTFTEEGCYVTRQTWYFGDGNSSNQPAPIHQYGQEGTYNGFLKVYYRCPSCLGELEGSIDQEFVFNIPDLLFPLELNDQRPIYQQVISTGATTFSSNWPFISSSPGDGSVGAHTLHPYKRGLAGVWRPEGSHVYNSSGVARKSSNSVNLSIDGTFDATQYAWQSPIQDALPKWLKANTITAYNPESQEIENQDVLGVYTSSIYGYGGNLPIAAGNDMANREMGFTSFEEVEVASGNFIVGVGKVNIPTQFTVVSGRSNILVVDEDFDVVRMALPDGEPVTVITDEHVLETTVLCVGQDGNGTENPFPGKTIVILAERVSQSNDLFFNGLLIKEEQFNGTGTQIVNDWAHSGRHSMQIPNTLTSQSIDQPIFNLIAGKTYALYGWASTKKNDVFYPTPYIANNLEVTILIDGVPVAAAKLDGPIIEGWQSVKGTFTIPDVGYDKLTLDFKKGDETTAFFDDVRIFPLDGNMQGFVYDSQLRLSATLDENNYATYYDYDGENNLFLVRKETVRGIRTIQQSISNQRGPQK